MTPKIFKTCASQTAPVLTVLYNKSLQECQVLVPMLWKKSVIVPVPKKSNPVELNDFRPVALTSQVMKCMEHLVIKRLTAQTAPHMDPLQFAYRPRRSVEDATSVLVHRIADHLDRLGTYARVLFIDFSSAFNTMKPCILYGKLQAMVVELSLCNWILDYLCNRSQQVRVNDTLSSTTSTYIGAPQGCVLSPALFTIYTNDHRGSEPHSLVIKYADDSAVAGLIVNNDERPYRECVENIVKKCEQDELSLNVKKTKEMRLDFRKIKTELEPVHIKGAEVEEVITYDYLGTTLTNNLS